MRAERLRCQQRARQARCASTYALLPATIAGRVKVDDTHETTLWVEHLVAAVQKLVEWRDLRVSSTDRVQGRDQLTIDRE